MIREDFGGILNRLRTDAGMSQLELAACLKKEGLEVTNQHIYKWEKNINRPSASQFIALCLVFGIHDITGVFAEASDAPYSRLNPEGQRKVREYIKVLDASGLYALPVAQGDILPFKKLPVYTQPASAGTGLFLDSDAFDEVEVHREVSDKADFGIRISGDSMMPQYIDGQIVWVHRQNSLNSGEIGIFLLNGDAYIKKFELNDRKASLVSLNSTYAPILVKDSDTLVIYGKVMN